MADDLQGYIQGEYLRFDENGEIAGIYKGHTIEDDPFGKEKGEKRVAYTIEVDGEDKKLTSKSKRLAGRVIRKGLKGGENITIKRRGVGFETDYEIVIGGEKE